MFYVYIIRSEIRDELYTGSTNDLKRRIEEHNSGKELSTKRYKPWKLIYYEAYLSESDARNREKKLKYHGNAMKELKKRIQQSLTNGAGFTLIEILVVISITGFLVTMGISSYMDFNRRQVLDQTAKNIVNDLRLAQSKASSGDKGPSPTPAACATNPLSGWYFKVTADNIYTIYGLCGATPITAKTVNLPSNVFFTTAIGTVILFKPLNLGIGSNASIVIQLGSNTKIISVTTGGTIN